MSEALPEPRTRFARAVASPDEQIELDRTLLLIALEEYPELDLDRYLDILTSFADRVRNRLHRDAGPFEQIAILRTILVEEEGFAGNVDEYDDPRNSFLNDVLDRRTGIPITLSVVYMEVARRVGFLLKGVSYPGHFLVKHPTPRSPIILDPFHDGRILEETDLRTRLAAVGVNHEEHLLQTTTARALLFRALSNLKTIYLRGGDRERALAAVERMLLLAPDKSPEMRDRGLLLAQLGRPLEALHQLTAWRSTSDRSEATDEIEALMERLKQRVGMSN